jgi:hypothetical protein
MNRPHNGTSASLQWSAADMTAFDEAHALISAVIAAYSARIGAAGDAETAGRLRQARSAYLAERQSLSVADRERIRQIREEYPALLQRVRQGKA